jgi:hypothetical protein
MTYEVVTVEFRTELHARWSIFFDHLKVPWAYEPVGFADAQGTLRTPAFWLPEQRIWFDAEVVTPAWWGRFAMAAAGSDDWADHFFDEDAGRCLPVQVPEHWRGLPLLFEGPNLPDGEPGDGDITDGPWRLVETLGMRTYDDQPYQWTLCPQCGTFGATFWGYAQRLECGCLKEYEQRKIQGSSDKRLLTAYWAMDAEDLHPPGLGESTLLLPTTLDALVDRSGTDECRCVGPRAVRDRGVCPVCHPAARMAERQVRQQLNGLVDQLAAATGQLSRTVNVAVNKAIGVKSRTGLSLAQLGAALTQAEQWLEDPSSMLASRPSASPEDLEKLHGRELRERLTAYVGPLSSALREPIPYVQQRLNDWMGVATRAEAPDDLLRDAIMQAAAWLADPDLYYVYVTPQPVEPGGLPAPVHTKAAAAESACNLCTAPVAAGELMGRMPRPRQPFTAMGWLCAHCLYERRAKPRLTDVALRVFHHTFSGSSTTPLNAAEAKTLHDALTRTSPQPEDEHLNEAITALREGVDTDDPAMLLRYYPARAAIAVLPAAYPDLPAADKALLTAVADHLRQWQDNPNGPDKEQFANGVQRRQAILAASATPTPLSQRGGPFWV